MEINEIENLINMPKKIVEAPPKEFRQEGQHLRKDFTLQSTEGNFRFSVFIRRHIDFQENFSIGLIFHPVNDKEMVLFRCNGNHGEVVEEILRPSLHFDYHIHKLTPEDLQKGIREPSFSETIKAYNSYDEAFQFFIKKINVLDADKYFSFQQNLFKE